MGSARGIRLVGRFGLALLLLLAWAPAVHAQVGFIQVGPGLQRAHCTDITNPVANQSWCGNGNPPYDWQVWNGTAWVPISGGAGNPAPPDTSVQFNDGGVFGGDSRHLWNNTLKRLQVGTLPLGPLAPGPLVVGLTAPTGTGMQAGLFQTTTGTAAGQGLVTLGADNVAVSGWAFRGADGTNPLYGGNFGVHFLGPGQVRGVEIDVQNEHADAGIGAFGHDVGLWLNRSGTWNSSSAIEISSQDNRGWWYGIHFDPGGAGTGSAPLIKGWGIYAFRAMPDQYIGFVPSDDANPDNDIVSLYAFDGTTKKASIVKRGRFLGRGDSTGVTQPTFSFVDDPTTGVYTAAPSQVGLGVLGAEVFKAVAAGTVTTGYEMSIGTTFASLGIPNLPAVIWCSDCQETNPCTGGSVAGAWAFRVATNTSWSCTFGGGGTGTLTGSGTTNTLAKFTAATVLGDSKVTENGTTVTIVAPSTLTYPAQAAASGHECLQTDTAGLITKTGLPCASGFAGETVIADTATTASVVFASAQPDTTYVVTLGTRPNAGTPPAVLARYLNKTVNGFDLEITAPPGSGNAVAVNWSIGTGSFTGVVGPTGPGTLIKQWTIPFGDPGAGSPILANDNDQPVAVTNHYGMDLTITAVTCACDTTTGGPTVDVTFSGGGSILTGAIACGAQPTFAAGTLSGTPIVKTFSGTGATCSTPPCSLDIDITPGGTAKFCSVDVVGTL